MSAYTLNEGNKADQLIKNRRKRRMKVKGKKGKQQHLSKKEVYMIHRAAKNYNEAHKS